MFSKHFLLSPLSLLSILFLVLLLSGRIAEAQGEEIPSCDGPYKGQKLSASQFARIVKAHAKSLVDARQPGASRANLCDADLRGLDFRFVDLRVADFRGANLAGNDLTGASLSSSDFRGANLVDAVFDGAILNSAKFQKAQLTGAKFRKRGTTPTRMHEAMLQESDLRRADFEGAHLHRAKFRAADLSDAKLRYTTLTSADMVGADLQGADLRGALMREVRLENANLADVIFELEPNQMPDLGSIARARNLAKLTYVDLPITLAELRAEFRKAGLREQEREITFAIKHAQRKQLWERGVTGKLESLFQLLFFEYTSRYGMNPGQALLILVKLMFSLIPLYMWAMVYHSPRAMIVATCSHRLEKPLHQRHLILRESQDADFVELRVTVDFFFPRTRLWLASRDFNTLNRVLYVFALIVGSFYFSLLSAFRLGWRDLNVGTWISRIQLRDYQLRGIGLVKLVSGTQSLLSVYLLALWVLTYFTRIFQ